MTPRPFCCVPDDGVIACASLMEREDLAMVPVVEGYDTRRLIGVVTDRGLCLEVIATGADPRDVTVEECMEDELFSAAEDDDLDQTYASMLRRRVLHLPVVDRGGACVGVLDLPVAAATSTGWIEVPPAS